MITDEEFEKIKKQAEKLKHEFIVLNTTAHNAGVFSMTEEKAREFHAMINKWMETGGMDVTVTNRYWNGEVYK
jgi:hypothetical protein